MFHHQDESRTVNTSKVLPGGASPPGRIRKFRIAAILVGSIVGLFCGLVFYLWYEPTIYLYELGHEVSGHRYLYDKQLGWKNIPGWKATTFDKPLTINSKGLRDREYAYRKPGNCQRILALGDSYTWGYGVGDDQIYTEVMERSLSERQPVWQVLNAGVSGWGTDQQYLYLKQEGFHYSPDIVIVGFFYMNDFANNAWSEQYGLQKPVFVSTELDVANVPVPKPGDAGDIQPTLTPVNPFELTVSIFRHMAAACADQNCRLVVLKFGVYLDPQERLRLDNGESGRKLDNYRRMNAEATQFEQMLTKLDNLYYFDLDHALEQRGHTIMDLQHGNHDSHWNSFAHGEIAEVVIDFLEKHQLLEDEGS